MVSALLDPDLDVHAEEDRLAKGSHHPPFRMDLLSFPERRVVTLGVTAQALIRPP